MEKHTKRQRQQFAGVAILTLMMIMVLGQTTIVNAAATTVTLKVGANEIYGNYNTHIRWVTHINGEVVDLDDEPGVSRSYAYCVQPAATTPPSGEYKVTVIDEDDTGRCAKMRKMIYYLPGAYGYKKVTKSRWFDKMPSGTSAYTLGHIALSYLYDNCKSDTDAFMGTNEAIKDKVKSMISDLKNLKDPPDDFEIFWIKVSGYQDTIGAFYRTEYGKAKVSKSSALPLISEGNRCYSLAGAKYTLYEDKACKTAAQTKSGDKAVITTKADGSSEAITVETGDYYIKETTAPKGYELNSEAAKIEIEKDKTATYKDKDIPKSNPAGVVAQKVDKETGIAKAQGAATLEGAEFEVKYYDSDSTEGEPLRTWVFRTDKEGKVDMSQPDKYMVAERSADLYRNAEDVVVIPLGSISVKEIAAPEGYCINLEEHAAQVTVEEQVHRGDLSFTKSVEGGRRLANIPFRLTSVTTGESHIVVTDRNGYVNTSSDWNPHDTMDDENATGETGVWFNGYNDAEKGAPVNNALGALPYDTYQIDELPCEGNKDCTLINDTVTISRHNTLVQLGTYDDKLIPQKTVKEETPEPEPQPETKSEPDPEKKETKKVEKKVEKPEEKKAPETGDENQLILYLAAFLLACCEAVLLTAMKRNDRLCNERKGKR